MIRSKAKAFPAQEVRTIYGLRVRATGEMVRMRTEAVTRGDVGDLDFSLTTDERCPIFDAGFEEGLELLFVKPDGSGELSPRIEYFKPSDLEPVILTETVTREIVKSKVSFEETHKLDPVYAFDVSGKIVETIDGLRDLVDIVAQHSAEISAVKVGPEGWPAGRHYLTGFVLREKMSDIEHVTVGARIDLVPARRFLAAFDVPTDLLADFLPRRRMGRDEAPTHATLAICLCDARKLPHGLVQAIQERFAAGPSISP